MEGNSERRETKMGFFARLMDKLDKKMREKALSRSCCCGSKEKKDAKSCCS